jgi:hypothetical protein
MARTTPPSDPSPKLEELKQLQEMAFEAEQAIADTIAATKLMSGGLGDSLEEFDARHGICAIIRLLQQTYDHSIYPLASQLRDIVSDMQESEDSPKEGA